MKNKSILFAAAAVGLFAFSSCVKDWNCQCTIGSGELTVVTNETIKNTSLKKANEECENKDAVSFGTCKIKV